MSATVSLEDLGSISDVELAFGTTRFLPEAEEIPVEFNSVNNVYARIVSDIFYGSELPAWDIELEEGVKPEVLNKFIRAHLTSWEPKHERKIAGVAYLLSKFCTITPSHKEVPTETNPS